MRTLACISLIAAMSLAVPCAGASPQEERGLSEIQIIAPVIRSWYMNPQQLAEVQGTFILSTGGVLRLTSTRGGKLYGDLDRRGETELVPIAENVFVSKDRSMAIEYKPVPFDDEVVLSYKTDVVAGKQGFVTEHLAFNR